MDIAKKHAGLCFETPPQGAQRTGLVRDLAYVYLYGGQVKKSKEFFQLCIETTRFTERGDWPSSEMALDLLLGLASCQAQLGNETEASKALETSLILAENLFDNFDDRTAEISSRLKRLKERQEVNLDHHKAALVASTGYSRVKRPPAEPAQSPLETLEYLHRRESGTHYNASSTSENVGHSGPGQQDGAISRSHDHQMASWPFLSLVVESDKLSWGTFRDMLKAYDDADINIPWQGKSLLMWLLRNTSSAAAHVLLEDRPHDIDVNIQDSKGCTALDYAVDHHQSNIISLLIQRFGVDINQPNAQGKTPILRALNEGAAKRFKVLGELGADLDEILDETGWTPRLAGAAYGWYGSLEAVPGFEYIDPNRRDDRGRTALHYALTARAPIEHFKALLDWGVDINATDCFGRSVLHYTCTKVISNKFVSDVYI